MTESDEPSAEPPIHLEPTPKTPPPEPTAPNPRRKAPPLNVTSSDPLQEPAVESIAAARVTVTGKTGAANDDWKSLPEESTGNSPQVTPKSPAPAVALANLDDVGGTWATLPMIPEGPKVTVKPAVSPAETTEPTENNALWSSLPLDGAGTRTSTAMSGSVMSSELPPSRYQEDFQALQLMANLGPPRTLDDRYARHVIENRLGLTPLMYNMMVFGEVPTAPAQDTYRQ